MAVCFSLYPAIKNDVVAYAATQLDRRVNSEILVGSVKINIPAPDSFVNVTNTRPELAAYFNNATMPAMRFQALLLSTKDAQSKYPELSRYFLVQSIKSLESQIVTQSMFYEVREATHEQIKEQIDKRIVEANQMQTVQDLEMKIGETTYVPFESNSVNHIAYSFLTKIINKEMETIMMAATEVLLLANNRVIHISACSRYRTVNDLAWTQNSIEKLVTEIVKLNTNT